MEYYMLDIIYTRRAFTIIELLIVLTILSIILAIGVPNYMRSREESLKNTCIANMKQINSAMDEWVIEKKITTGTVPSESDEVDIYSYLKGGRPECPSKGVYTLHEVGSVEQVTCSRADKGHLL
jgi:prepilin-type N-terminal cleavage/methylation domain-containing protein